MLLLRITILKRRGQLISAAVTAFLLLAFGWAMRAAPEMALQYWYLLSVPLMLGALKFGRRGALGVSCFNVGVLTLAFQASGQNFAQATAFVLSLLVTASSPEEAVRLARQFGDLRALDPQTTFSRALLGMVISAASAILLGNSVDHGRRTSEMLTRLYRRLSQYCPPQIVRAIATHEGAPAITSVRKEITVLFADLRGFTSLAEHMEPEDLASLLNEFFSTMTDEVLLQDGCLDKYIGDEIMAFFGDPIEHPDHPQRAFQAALAMQRKMRGLNNRWQERGWEPVGMGIGIATGHATVGITGSTTRLEYTALGSIVNVASRLSDLALPGQILTTRKTYWHVQDWVDGVSQGPTRIKGFAQTVDVVDILGQRVTRRNGETSVAPRWTEIISRVVNDSAYRGVLLWNPDKARSMFPLDTEEQKLAQQVAILSGYPIFRGVPSQEIAALMGCASVEEYPEGAVVVQQGAEEDQFYVLTKGDVVITVRDSQSRERHIASLSRGDHFGEVSLLFDTPRTATVRTVSPSAFLVLHREVFYGVLSQAPTLRRNIEAAAQDRQAQPFPLRAVEEAEQVAAAATASLGVA